MGFLAGKRLLVTGVLSNRSIAYEVAVIVCCYRQRHCAWYLAKQISIPRHDI
jgi:hypothetical protein